MKAASLGGPILLVSLLNPCARAQGPAPGARLFGLMDSQDVQLVDPHSVELHRWSTGYQPGMGVYLLEDGSVLRSIAVPGAGLGLAGAGGGVQRLAFDGTVLWDFRYHGPGYLSHHDIQPLPNGNVILMAWEEKTAAQAIAAGRDPALISGTVFRPDHLVEIQPRGATGGSVVWEWHLWDHLVQDRDSGVANYGDVAAHPERVDINFPQNAAQSGDWNHLNGIDYDPIHDWIAISAHHQSEIWIIDHSTTSAQAAGSTGGRWGRGGDLLYRWGNPAAARLGTANDQILFGQHDPRFILPGRPGAGHLTVFNNGRAATGSSALEIELPLDSADNFVPDSRGYFGPVAPAWSYSAAGFFSRIISSAERLPNGNTLICSGAQGWLFEVSPGGQVVWSYLPAGPGVIAWIFHAHYVERSLWASAAELSAAGGGGIDFDLLGGSAQGLRGYMLLASASGTSPGVILGSELLPLNRDPIFDFTLLYPNNPPWLDHTLGMLSTTGGAQASFHLAPGAAPGLPGGFQLHFAAALIDWSAPQIAATSNPVPVMILP